MLTALQAVRAENNGGAFAHTVGALEGFDALIVVLLLLGAFCSHEFVPFQLIILIIADILGFEKGIFCLFCKKTVFFKLSLATCGKIEYNI